MCVFFSVAFILIYGLLRLVITKQKLKWCFLFTVWNSQKKQKEKKAKEDVKQEMLKSIKERNDEYEPNLHEMSKNVRKLKDAINIIKQYD